MGRRTRQAPFLTLERFCGILTFYPQAGTSGTVVVFGAQPRVAGFGTLFIMKQNEADIKFMALALEEARAAMERKEVPIGAVVVIDGAVIGRGHNLKESSCDPTAHAEIVAIKAAAERQKSWRLSGATLYVTLEPCLMCMGAIIQARLARIVFASFDPKAGACGSLYDVSNDSRLNHSVEVASGVSDSESKVLLQRFFSALRQRNKKDK